MRKSVQMTFIKGKNVRGYMGHWQMNYYVENVIDLSNNELICQEYVFKGSTIFKGLGLKFGDKVTMDINVDKTKTGSIKLSYYSNIKELKENGET